MDNIRYDCDIEGLEGNWIEFSPVWSQKQQAAFFATNDESIFGMVAKKIAAMHLVTVDGDTLESPEDYCADRLGDLHVALYSWVSHAVMAAVVAVSRLGEENRRQLLRTPEVSANGQLTPS